MGWEMHSRKAYPTTGLELCLQGKLNSHKAFKASLKLPLAYFVPPLPCPAPPPTLAAHLALVDGHGPGQLEGQLLPTEEPAPSGLHRPAFSTDDLGDST